MFIFQLENEGHKILKIVLSRSLVGKLDQFSYSANDWDKVGTCLNKSKSKMPNFAKYTSDKIQ